MVNLPKSLDKVEDNLAAEGDYCLHFSSVFPDVIKNKTVLKCKAIIDDTPSYEDKSKKKYIGKSFEVVYYIDGDNPEKTEAVLRIFKNMCENLQIPEENFKKSTFEPELLLNKPFIATVTRESYNNFVSNKLRPFSYKMSNHDFSTKEIEYNPEEEQESKEDLPF